MRTGQGIRPIQEVGILKFGVRPEPNLVLQPSGLKFTPRRSEVRGVRAGVLGRADPHCVSWPHHDTHEYKLYMFHVQ